MTHTPGPWSIVPPVRGYAHSVMAPHPGGTRIACADIPEGLDADGVDALANARLIAAAPDLLAELKSVVKEIKTFHPTFTAHLFVAAERAIAKAEGVR